MDRLSSFMNPVYGGSAKDLLGDKFARLRQAEREQIISDHALALQSEAIKLRKGKAQPTQDIVYPVRRH